MDSQDTIENLFAQVLKGMGQQMINASDAFTQSSKKQEAGYAARIKSFLDEETNLLAKIAEKDKAVAEAQEERDSEKRLRSQLESRNSNLERHLKNEQEKTERLTTDLGQTHKAMDQWGQMREESVKTAKEWKQKFDEAQRDLRVQTKLVVDAQEELKAVRVEKAHAETTLQETQKRLELLTKERNQYQKDATEWEKLAQEASDTIGKQETEIAKLQSAKDLIETESAQQKQSLEELNAKSTQMKTELIEVSEMAKKRSDFENLWNEMSASQRLYFTSALLGIDSPYENAFKQARGLLEQWLNPEEVRRLLNQKDLFTRTMNVLQPQPAVSPTEPSFRESFAWMTFETVRRELYQFLEAEGVTILIPQRGDPFDPSWKVEEGVQEPVDAVIERCIYTGFASKDLFIPPVVAITTSNSENPDVMKLNTKEITPSPKVSNIAWHIPLLRLPPHVLAASEVAVIMDTFEELVTLSPNAPTYTSLKACLHTVAPFLPKGTNVLQSYPEDWQTQWRTYRQDFQSWLLETFALEIFFPQYNAPYQVETMDATGDTGIRATEQNRVAKLLAPGFRVKKTGEVLCRARVTLIA